MEGRGRCGGWGFVRYGGGGGGAERRVRVERGVLGSGLDDG